MWLYNIASFSLLRGAELYCARTLAVCLPVPDPCYDVITVTYFWLLLLFYLFDELDFAAKNIDEGSFEEFVENGVDDGVQRAWGVAQPEKDFEHNRVDLKWPTVSYSVDWCSNNSTQYPTFFYFVIYVACFITSYYESHYIPARFVLLFALD